MGIIFSLEVKKKITHETLHTKIYDFKQVTSITGNNHIE